MIKNFFLKKKFFITVLLAAICAIILLFLCTDISVKRVPEYETMLQDNSFLTMRNEGDSISDTFENVRPSIVQIRIGNVYGEGCIWDMSESAITILTNRHIVENFDAIADNDVNGNYVVFYTGEAARVSLVGVSYDQDAAFLQVAVSELDPEKICSLRKVRKDDTVYDKLKAGDAVISISSSDRSCEGPDDDRLLADEEDSGIADIFYQGKIRNTAVYVEDLQKKMLYTDCYSEEGMSGSGIFDTYGNYIGMLTGGDENGGTVAIPLSEIVSCEMALSK